MKGGVGGVLTYRNKTRTRKKRRRTERRIYRKGRKIETNENSPVA